jgi:predicted HAD superfamily Cof-like phosphohydrolase
MLLSAYLDKYEISKIELSARSKISKQTLHRLMNGNTIDLPTAARIELATYGKVTCMEIYEEFMCPSTNSVDHKSKKAICKRKSK